MDYVVPAPPQPSLPVIGTPSRFPVRRIYCAGRNYLAHVREFGNDEKAPPLFFSKAGDMIVESGSTIPYPSLTQNYHHEVELVVAIGKGGANIPPESALDHSAPCSAIHPAEQVGHFAEGEIQIAVNGQVRQHSDVSLMIWDVAHI